MNGRFLKRFAALLALAALVMTTVAPAATMAAKPPARGKPEIHTNRDKAKEKIHPRLLAQVNAGKNPNVFVFATVVGNPAAARKLLTNSRVATAPNGKASIVVGRTKVQQLTKLASLKGVVAVSPVELKKTGSPLGSPDPDVTRNITNAALKGAFKQLRGSEVPYSAAPPLKASNFEQLEELALLDAKTHRFAEAWQAGYSGAGSVVSVLDGGTDFGHPDLIGTWQTRATTGWPNAFDPFGTLVLLVQPSNVDLGLTWYTKTEAKNTFTQSVQDKAKGIARVDYDVRVGPSRNFAAPDAKVTRTYAFPRAWSKSGTVRLGGHPDDHLLGLFGERAAFIVVDPTTAGVYDTVYVDLDNDHSFVDEKPVTRESPVSYRDMNGDGVTDVSGGLLYYISNGTGASGAALPGGPSSFGLVVKDAPGALLAWTGDFDPAIGGHGTLTASNVVGQGVINGLAPTFADVPGGTPPGMVIGGAPHAKLAPMGDIYFSFDFSTQFAYFLTQAQPAHSAIDITSNSYGNSAADNDGFDAAQPGSRSLEHDLRGPDADDRIDRQWRSGLRHDERSFAGDRHERRRLHPVRRHRLGFDQEPQPDPRQRRHRLVRPRPRRDRRERGRRRRRRRLFGRRRDAQRRPQRQHRLDDVGRHEPLDARRGGRRRARLPSLAAGERGHHPARLRPPRAGHHQVLGQGSRLRLLDPGSRVGRRPWRRPPRHRGRRSRGHAERVAARRLPRRRVRRLPERPRRGRERQPDVRPRRQRDLPALRPVPLKGGE